MASGSTINVDNIIRSLNHLGRFNIMQYGLVILNSFSVSSNILAIVFIGLYPDHQCRPYDNTSVVPTELKNYTSYGHIDNKTWIEYGKCSVDLMSKQDNVTSRLLTIPCSNGYVYKEPKGNSIVSEWDLVCEKAALGPFTQFLQTIGMTLGAMLVPTFADRYGRRPVIILCQLLLGASSFGVTFSTNLHMFAALRLAVGFFQQGLAVPQQNIAMEMFPTEHRAVIAMLYGFNWCLGCFVLVLEAYLVSSFGWRVLSLMIACNSTVVIISIFFMEESLRWLFANGYTDRAKAVIKKAAKMNKLNFDEIWNTHVARAYEMTNIPEKDVPLEEVALESNHHDNDETSSFLKEDTTTPVLMVTHKETNAASSPDNPSLLTLFTNPALRLILLINVYCWFMASMSYYGLYLTSGSLDGSHYFNFFMNTFCEFVAMATLWKGFEWFGRKKTLVTHFTFGSLSLIATTVLSLVLDKESNLRILVSVASFIGMFGMAGAFADLWSYLPELVPTHYRNLVVGLASSSARIGSALSPFSAFLAQIIPWGPAVIFSSGCFIANILILMLPESRGRQLPQTIADVEAWMRKDKKKKNKNLEETKSLANE
ncbi:solute carrier family 22 member 8-like [Argonauta hians]